MSKKRQVIEETKTREEISEESVEIPTQSDSENTMDLTADDLDYEEVEETEESEAVIGEVCNCMQLNIREKADKESKPICAVPVFTKLVVDVESSTEEWFKVYTESGIEGFCMKRYVSLQR